MGTRQIRLGVVGARNIGKVHMRAAGRLADVVQTAVAEPDAERRASAVEQFQIPHAFDSAQAMFASGTVDAVALAVPNALHAPLSIAAMEAGLDVLVEKPIAMSVDEADAMIRTRDRTGRTLMVGMNQRFGASAAAIKKAIDDGRIGKFQFGRTWWTQQRMGTGLWERGDWFYRPETSGGGPLLDLGIHRLDLALWWLGFPPVRSVTGIATHGIGRREAERHGKQYLIEDAAVGLVRFADGTALDLSASYFMNTPHHEQGTLLMGTDGWINTAAEPHLTTYTSETIEPTDLPTVQGWPDTCVGHFVEVLLGRQPLCPTAEQARAGLQIVQGIYESARTGRPVDFAE